VSGISKSQPSYEIFCMSFLKFNNLNSLPEETLSENGLVLVLGLKRLLNAISI